VSLHPFGPGSVYPNEGREVIARKESPMTEQPMHSKQGPDRVEAATGCCPPAEQSSCCEPSAKAGCCGKANGQGCGCR
jgi:hypothetical protein